MFIDNPLGLFFCFLKGIVMLKDETIKRLDALGYHIMNKDEISTNDVNDKMSFIDDDGYKYYTTAKHILAGHKPFIVYKDNIYSIVNIQLYLSQNKDLYDNFELLSKQYENSRDKLKFKCKTCGSLFTKPWYKIQTGCRCNNCLEEKRGYYQMISPTRIDRLINYPDVAIDFNYDNNEYPIETYTAKSGQLVNWKCHICGYEWTTSPSHRINDMSGCPSCAHKMSKGERCIHNYLNDNNVVYVQEKRFNDCRDKQPLPFDFYLPDYNTCIEYDGEQHRKPIKFNQKTTDEKALEQFLTLQRHDEIKNNYCQQHQITLVRISDYNNIQCVLDSIILGKST